MNLSLTGQPLNNLGIIFPTSEVHPEYRYYYHIWRMIDDFVLGEKQVKSRSTDYLPKTEDWSEEQYREYLEFAPFTNFTVRTINALLGAMFLKDPLVELPENVKYLESNADGQGNSLMQFVRRLALEAIKKGRSGVYVDFPRVEPEDGARAPTLAQTANLKAAINHYDALSILDWEEDDEGLTMVKLREFYRVDLGNFQRDYEEQIRYLYLDEGVYRVQIHRGDNLHDEYTPTNANGQPFDFIPFFFNGAINNDASADNSPVYEIVSKNKTHYQIEAEIMRSIRMFSTPMMVVSTGDIPAQEFLRINDLEDGKPLKYGASRGLVVGSGGSAELLQAKANDMAQNKADKVLQEAMMLGARLVTRSSGRATAEQIRIETSAENAVINSIAKNIERTIINAINCCQLFMQGSLDEVIFSMNTEFYAQSADAQILGFAKEMLSDPSQVFAPEDMLVLLKNSGLIDSNRTMDSIVRDAQQYQATLENERDEVDTNEFNGNAD